MSPTVNSKLAATVGQAKLLLVIKDEHRRQQKQEEVAKIVGKLRYVMQVKRQEQAGQRVSVRGNSVGYF